MSRPPVTRRQLLGGIASGSYVALSGCNAESQSPTKTQQDTTTNPPAKTGSQPTSEESTTQDYSVDGKWTVYKYDRGQTGRVQELGPTAEPSIVWSTDATRYYSPVIEGDRLFCATPSTAYAYDLTTGTQLWETNLGNIVGMPAGADDFLFFNTDGDLHAVEKQTGESIWTVNTGEAAAGTHPVVHDGTVYVGSQNNRVYAIDIGANEVNWYFTTDYSVYGAIAVGQSGIFCNAYDTVHKVSFDGSSVWEYDLPASSYVGPSFESGTVFVGGFSGVYAVNAENGDHKWTHVIESPADRSVPSIGGESAYVANEKVKSLNKQTGELNWSYDVGSYGGSVTIGESQIYHATNGSLYALSKEGLLSWQISIPGEDLWNPKLIDQTLFVAGESGLHIVRV